MAEAEIPNDSCVVVNKEEENTVISGKELNISMMLLEQLQMMGIPLHRAERALFFAGSNIDTALDWALSHTSPIDDQPLTVADVKRLKDIPPLLEVNDDDDDVVRNGNDGFKMTLIVRTDLNMSVGKIAAQCAHAAVGLFQRSSERDALVTEEWSRSGQKKIVLQVPGEGALAALEAQAKALGIMHYMVRDAGKTEVAPHTKTVLALGPAREHRMNAITGSLKTLK